MLPTPIHRWPVPGLAPGCELWVKRDDLSGCQLSGTKVCGGGGGGPQETSLVCVCVGGGGGGGGGEPTGGRHAWWWWRWGGGGGTGDQAGCVCVCGGGMTCQAASSVAARYRGGGQGGFMNHVSCAQMSCFVMVWPIYRCASSISSPLHSPYCSPPPLFLPAGAQA